MEKKKVTPDKGGPAKAYLKFGLSNIASPSIKYSMILLNNDFFLLNFDK